MRIAIIILIFCSCSPVIIEPVVMDVPQAGVVVLHDDCWLEDCMPVCFDNGGTLELISVPNGSLYTQSDVDACIHIYDVDSECITGDYIFECTVESKCEGCPDDIATLTLESDDGELIMFNGSGICN